MYEVDARGLSCPEPLMMASAAMKSQKGAVKVLVSEVNQKNNIEKYAHSQGRNVRISEKGPDFELVIE